MHIFLRFSSAVVLALFMGDAAAAQSLELALELAKSKAYRSREVDWPSIEAQARTLEASQGEDAAIRMIVAALGDRHTSYITAATAAPRGAAPVRAASPPIAEIQQPARSIPVLQINRWSGSDMKAATSTVNSALGEALSSKPCGLILDFSGNNGGNMWPMLIGLKPLLSSGDLGAFRHPDGTVDRIAKEDGLIQFNGRPHFLNYPLPVQTPDPPRFIAIIIGAGSASSGEITPLMFFGQKNVRFFGRKSSGFTSANQVFPLPNGGKLVLTTSMTEDRNGHSHLNGIEPDSTSTKALEDSAQWLDTVCHR